MIQCLDIRRHPDGSIDIDFYRRRASRHRQLARRLVFRHCLFAIGQAARGVISAIESSMIHDSQAPRNSCSIRKVGTDEVVQPT